MADTLTITRPPQVEATNAVHPSPISHLFPQLLIELADFIAAERSIEEIDVWDTAFLEWIRHAEKARLSLLHRLEQILATTEAYRGDTAFRRVTHLLQRLVTCDDDVEFRELCAMTTRHDWLFRWPNQTAEDKHISKLLFQTQNSIQLLATLSCLDDGFVVEHDELQVA